MDPKFIFDANEIVRVSIQASDKANIPNLVNKTGFFTTGKFTVEKHYL